MTLNKFRFWTGPCTVEDAAAMLKDHFNTVTAGTEWVYVLTSKTREDVLAEVTRHFGGYTLRDIQEL